MSSNNRRTGLNLNGRVPIGMLEFTRSKEPFDFAQDKPFDLAQDRPTLSSNQPAGIGDRARLRTSSGHARRKRGARHTSTGDRKMREQSVDRRSTVRRQVSL